MKQCLLTFAGLALVGVLTSTVSAQNFEPWDLRAFSQPGQHTTWLENPDGGFCGVPVELGDYDGDGFLDYAVAPIMADGGPGNSRTDSGIVYVFQGDGAIGGTIDLMNAPAGQPMITIWGAAPGDLIGTELYSADLDADGLKDLIIGASGVDAQADRAGAVYILWGSTNPPALIDLSVPNPLISRFTGIDLADRLGFWVEAGDVDGDGTDDLLMSSDDGDGPNNSGRDRGEAYVVYGGSRFPANVSLRTPPAGLRMLTIYGEDDRDQLGSSMHSVDLDADGFEEIIVSAALNRAIGAVTGAGIAGGDGPGNGRNGCGDTYIIWGRANLPSVIDLRQSRNAMLAAGELTVIYGATSGDFLGEETSSGNVDGDAYVDLVLGAITADGRNDAKPNAGDTVILWGGPSLRGRTIDMQQIPAGTSTLYGEDQGDIGGDTLSVADVNGDGFDDVYFSEPNGDPRRPGGSTTQAGEIVILFGGPVRFPPESDVQALDASRDWPTRRIWGADQGDLLGYSMEGADFDGDGFAEIFPNAMRGDAAANLRRDAGEVTITSGRRFSEGLVTVTDAPSIGTSVALQGVGQPNQSYLAAFSLSDGPGFPLPGGEVLALADDFLFQLSITPGFPVFNGMAGTTGPQGRALWSAQVPADPSIVGFRLFTSFISFDALGIGTVGKTTSFVLQN